MVFQINITRIRPMLYARKTFSNIFFQGEKQLFCLGRALLNKSKILLIDEATSSVDLDTEKKIHEIIKTNLSDATLIGNVCQFSSIQ